MPRITDRLLRKRLAEYRDMARNDAKPSKFMWALRFAELVGIVLAVFALWQTQASLNYAAEQSALAHASFKEQSVSINENRITTAYQMLTENGTYSGKEYALQLLILARKDIQNIDLSCKKIMSNIIGIRSTRNNTTRPRRTNANGVYPYVRLPEGPNFETCHSEIGLQGSTFRAEITGPAFRTVDFGGINMSKAMFVNSSMTDVSFFGIYGSRLAFDNSILVDNQFIYADLSDTVFQPDNGGRLQMANHRFYGSALGYARFGNVEFTGTTSFERAKLKGAEFTEQISFNDTESFANINISDAELCIIWWSNDLLEKTGRATKDSDSSRSKRDVDYQIGECDLTVAKHVQSRMWYYEDSPPLGLEKAIFDDHNFVVCPNFDGGVTRAEKDGVRTVVFKDGTVKRFAIPTNSKVWPPVGCNFRLD